LRGHIENGGYDLIEDGENLQNFLNRSINLIKESSLNNIIISRKKNGEDEIYYVKPNQFSNFVLLSGDIIDVPRQDRIMVNGYVKNPGAYAFIPGHSAYNYITKAGGTTSDGSVNKVKIVRSNGEIINDFDAILERGDVIIIERSTTNALFGNLSLLQLITSILTIYMTYLSTSN
jgi:protein involved in polysaccharide export with SLBB domain